MYDIHLSTFPRFPPRARAHTHTHKHTKHTHTLSHTYIILNPHKHTTTQAHTSSHTHHVRAHGVGARLDQARHFVRVAVLGCLEH